MAKFTITKGVQAFVYEPKGDAVSIRHFHNGIVAHEEQRGIEEAREHFRINTTVNGFSKSPSSLELRAAGMTQPVAGIAGIAGPRERVQVPTHTWAERNLKVGR